MPASARPEPADASAATPKPPPLWTLQSWEPCDHCAVTATVPDGAAVAAFRDEAAT